MTISINPDIDLSFKEFKSLVGHKFRNNEKGMIQEFEKLTGKKVRKSKKRDKETRGGEIPPDHVEENAEGSNKED